MSNLKVQIQGTIYQINEKAFRTTGWNREPITPYFYASYVAAGQLVKQWVKKNYPEYVVRVKGSSFANGNSMDVNVCMPDGSPIPDADYRAISDFANLFEYGRYNGQEDMYESYENSGLITDNGTVIQAGVKYVHVDNRPSFGTTEWARYEMSTGRTYKELSRYCDTKILDKAMGL
jgi:hypothetical protein